MRPSARIVVALSIATTLIASLGISHPQKAAAATSTTTITWASGASGTGVANGDFAAWRGRSVDIAGTWSDDTANSLNFWQFQKGGDYYGWNKAVDVAVGGLEAGDTWKKAAAGAYDARWTQSLAKLKSVRSGTTASTYIRFAHEMNGNWYPWAVNSANYQDFMTAWKRYRAIQKKVFPAAKLVFNVNRESVGTGMSWTKFFPGSKYVDVLSVDYYNQYPYVGTAKQWTDSLDDVDQWGAPKGLAQHLAFAKKQGLPFAISEWSGIAGNGDSPAYVNGMLSYVKAHAGYGGGQIRYEILFNSGDYSNAFTLYGKGARMPNSSSAYRSFFSATTWKTKNG